MASHTGRSDTRDNLVIPQKTAADERSALPSLNFEGQEIEPVTHLAQAALRILAGKTLNGRKSPKVSDHCVNAFSRLLVSGQMETALNLTRVFMSRGADYGDIIEDLYAAAVRRIGDRWSQEDASMLEINIGVSTLIRTDIALRASLKEPRKRNKASAFFGSFTGQAHTLGLTLATGYFRQNGWYVQYCPATTPDQFIATVSDGAPDIVGMTAASGSDIDVVRDVIDGLRKLPFQPRVIVGGSSDHLACLKADAVASRLDMALLAGHRLTR